MTSDYVYKMTRQVIRYIHFSLIDTLLYVYLIFIFYEDSTTYYTYSKVIN